jgi:hypothetical protein
MAADLEKTLLATIGHACVEDSLQFAQEQGVDHLVVVGVIKSLEAYEMITVHVRIVSPPCTMNTTARRGEIANPNCTVRVRDNLIQISQNAPSLASGMISILLQCI